MFVWLSAEASTLPIAKANLFQRKGEGAAIDGSDSPRRWRDIRPGAD